MSQPPWPRGSLMASLGEDARAHLLGLGTLREFAPGSHLVIQGHESRDVLLLLSGVVKVVGETEDGDLSTLAVRVRGDAIGELGALDGHPRAATVTAAGLVTARVIDVDTFRAFLARHVEASLAVSASVGEKLRWANRRRIDYGRYEIPVRLARVLIELAEQHGYPTPDGLAVGLALTQPELATLIGASEPAVNRALRHMKEKGLVTSGYRGQVIRDLAGLRRMAGLPPQRDEHPVI